MYDLVYSYIVRLNAEHYYSIIKQGCKAHIKFELSDNCQSLQVTEIDENHHHEVSKV